MKALLLIIALLFLSSCASTGSMAQNCYVSDCEIVAVHNHTY